uniref:Uncharacterized protein n=1 Tax=Candidatus Methanophaga sp. ANME-1 ERB7 TaxID=2759913 RepID=A0A7G9Z622_9EURY|nr:hypothetical protein MNGCPPAP_00003 [Methanosarcinales archaeon ANME-1 ERB7]
MFTTTTQTTLTMTETTPGTSQKQMERTSLVVLGWAVTIGLINYTGEDSDGDGLGDTQIPYNSSGSIENGGDYLPLVKPSAP